MDFSRAKTVLIGAFLLLNLFLFYFLWEAEGTGGLGPFGAREEQFRLEEALKEVNLTLQTSLPRDSAQRSHVEVTPWRYETDEVINYLWKAFKKDEPLPSIETVSSFQENVEDETGAGEGPAGEYIFGDYKILINQEGTLTVKAENINCDFDDYPPEEDILESAENFTEQLPFMDDFVLDYKEFGEKYHVLYYRQQIEDVPLFAGYAEIIMCGDKILKFDFYRLEKQAFAQQKREVIPPSSALLRFVEEYKEDSTPAEIVQFEQGYYSKKYDAERWEIPPVWRIRLDTQENYYVNAFTGNLEK